MKSTKDLDMFSRLFGQLSQSHVSSQHLTIKCNNGFKRFVKMWHRLIIISENFLHSYFENLQEDEKRFFKIYF